MRCLQEGGGETGAVVDWCYLVMVDWYYLVGAKGKRGRKVPYK